MIGPFIGKYRFLSNFYPSEVFSFGLSFPTVEHAYQASKTTNEGIALRISQLPTPGQAKSYGRKIGIRPDWESVKLTVMTDLVSQKFYLHKDLAQLLIDTGSEELVEVNTWGDTFWGVRRGVGENNLGKILMQVRSSLL